MVLHLPDVAELVHEQVLAGVLRPEQDRAVERVPVEAADPRKPEEPRDDENAHTAQRDRPRVEVEPVEPLLRLRESSPLLRVHPAGFSTAEPCVLQRAWRATAARPAPWPDPREAPARQSAPTRRGAGRRAR